MKAILLSVLFAVGLLAIVLSITSSAFDQDQPWTPAEDDEDFFVIRRRAIYTSHRPRCKDCEQTQRDELKAKNRYLTKARSTYNHHARKFVAKGIISKPEELETLFEWRIPRMAKDMEKAYGHDCYICEEPFAGMPNGLQSLTLDILDPAQPPYYMANVGYPCQTCNRTKSKLSASDFARHRIFRKEARERRTRLANDPWYDTLFEGFFKLDHLLKIT